jgi:pimeloyl-ACP methyl ester carboxylesterase
MPIKKWPAVAIEQAATDPGVTMTATYAFTREETGFSSNGTRCAATVFRPTLDIGNLGTSRPVVVMAHGFGAPRAHRLYAYAESFARAGYLVVVFDYRYWGDSDGLPRHPCPAPTRTGSSHGAPRSPAATSSPSRRAAKSWPRSSLKFRM